MNTLSDEILDESLMFTEGDLKELCQDVDFDEELKLSPVKFDETIQPEWSKITFDVQPEWSKITFDGLPDPSLLTSDETVVEPDWSKVTLSDDLSNFIKDEPYHFDDVEINLTDLLNSPDQLQEWLLKETSHFSSQELNEYMSEFIHSDVGRNIEQVKYLNMFTFIFTHTHCH